MSIFKKISLLTLLPILLFIFLFKTINYAAEEKTKQGYYPANPQKGIVILELFSSQGCSSCPKADYLLTNIQEKAIHLNENIMYLNFHVDYWNYLGWVDPFSKYEFTQRQHWYNQAFKLNSIYTPQLIINGNFQIIGSLKQKIETEIQNRLKQPLKVQLKDIVTHFSNDSISISGSLIGINDEQLLNIAVLQKSAVTEIKSGENKGLKLNNTNIVRAFKTINIQNNNVFNIKINKPDKLSEEQIRVVLYAQNKNTLEVTAGCFITN
ncbi:MAG: DUF1223 domain-containing protein [Bacteroidales bacterium]